MLINLILGIGILRLEIETNIEKQYFLQNSLSLELLFSSQNLPICSDKKTPHNMN
jgi:hypothetical protein